MVGVCNHYRGRIGPFSCNRRSLRLVEQVGEVAVTIQALVLGHSGVVTNDLGRQ